VCVCMCFLHASSFSIKVKFAHKLVNNYVRTLYIEYSLLIIIKQRTGWKHTRVANILGRLKKTVPDNPQVRTVL